MPSRTLIALALAAIVATPALAADGPQADLTIYRSDSNALYTASTGSAVNAGYAVVHERRSEYLDAGTQDIVIGNLPDFLDPEAVHLSFDSGKVKVLSQRLLLPRGEDGSLSGHIGKSVTVLGLGGEKLAKGLLVRVNRDGSLVIGGDVFGPTLVRRYAVVKLTGGEIGGGARLQLRVDAGSAGKRNATLTYPTSGIGWRAAYTGILRAGHACQMQVDAQASIANRSGRDWKDADIKLVAGSPNMNKSNYRGPVMMKSMAMAAPPVPEQSTLGNYRSYTLPGAVTLPAGSVTLTPLYRKHTVDCERTLLFEHGNRYQPSKPVLSVGNSQAQDGPITDLLSFVAFDSFPAGYLRVLTVDDDGKAEFLGQDRVGDTPKGQPVKLTLGTAFDLTGTRERTAFQVDKAGRSMDVGYRITLTNAGNEARTVTVREHPWRWHVWKLVASSSEPTRQTSDTLEFAVKVPAGGKATLDYSVQYSWTAADE